MMNSKDDNNPRNSDAVARNAGKTAAAGVGRNGGNNSRPNAIGGTINRKQVYLFTEPVLIKIGQLKVILQNKKKLATEPCVQCIFFRKYYLSIFKNVPQDSITIPEQNFIFIINYEQTLVLHFCKLNKLFYEVYKFTEPFYELYKFLKFLISKLNFKFGYLIFINYHVHILLFFSLQERTKRTVDEGILDDESKNETKKRRGEKPKLSYSDVAKAGNIMMEIRGNNPRVQLGQPDYDNIEHSLAMAYVNLPAPRPTEMPQIFQMGLSQGGLWVGAKDEFTHQFMLKHIPTFIMPPGTGAYNYLVYGPNNRPYKYYKTTVPLRFWGSKKNLEDMIAAFHPQLSNPMLDIFGNMKIPHMRISSGMEDQEDIKGTHFPIVLEVDECLGPALGKLGGVLTILATKLRLVGGGIEKNISDIKDAKAAEAAAAIAAVEAAEATGTADSDFIDIDMEHEPSYTAPPAPPPPPVAGPIPPPPTLQQMMPRTPLHRKTKK
jgi:hypothetical protein